MAAISEDYAAQNGVREDSRWTWRDSKGRLHRDGDLPASIDDNGCRMWCQHGILHRDNDRPAIIIIGPRGCEKHWWVHGRRHRDNRPAEKYGDGIRHWKVYGKLHRIGGPAIEDPNDIHGTRWYVNGQVFPNGDDDEYKEACLEYIRTFGGRLPKGRLGT